MSRDITDKEIDDLVKDGVLTFEQGETLKQRKIVKKMEIRRKKEQVTQPKSSNSFLDGLLEIPHILAKAMEDQYFYNLRIRVLDFLNTIQGLKSAVVIMHIKKGKPSYKMAFDAIYTKEDGKSFAIEDFFEASLSSNDTIPNYILKEIQTNGEVDIKFDKEDIQHLYEEKEIKVEKPVTYEDLIFSCEENSVYRIKMIDRVFYTRVECYDDTDQDLGVIHVAKINKLPRNVYDELYPCKEMEVVVGKRIIY